MQLQLFQLHLNCQQKVCWQVSMCCCCSGASISAPLPTIHCCRPRAPRRYALPRPEGQRCLVVSSRGQTLARLRSGVLFERFASPLPAGSPGQPGGEDSFCILDCVYHAPDQTYYVLGGWWDGWAGGLGCACRA
jgi:hypothetical protein